MGGLLNNSAYTLNSVIDSCEVDSSKRIRISALMKRHQEIGEKHLNQFGTSSAKMRHEQSLAFIFTKVNIKITRLPEAGEDVTLTTWCSSLKGVRFTRNYVLRDAKGSTLTETKAEVTTIDLKSRKIVRPTDILGFEKFLYNEDLENTADYPKKLAVSDLAKQCFLWKIAEADIDFNGHVNNTVYADMVFEAISDENRRKMPKEFEINYQNEALLNETIDISVAVDGGEYMFSGKIGDKHCFAARLGF